MKNSKLRVVLVFTLLAGFCVSCVSLSDRAIPANERKSVEIAGKVQTTFTSWQPLWIILKNSIKKRAYSRLLAEAQSNYGNNVDVRNIQIKGGFSGYGLWVNPLLTGGVSLALGFLTGSTDAAVIGGLVTFAIGGDFQKITATGDVVILAQTSAQPQGQANRGTAAGIEDAVNRACGDLINELPAKATIAVINISSNDRETAAFVIEEVEFQLVNAHKFTVVDRKTLDTIRSEQNFQMSGDVSDTSAVSIGQMLGASIVITGTITRAGSNQRLSIRALDVKTAQIITMVRKSFL